MSRKNKNKPAAAAPPTSDNPGALPNEAEQTARDKQQQREASEMFAVFKRELGNSGLVSLSRSHPASGQYKPAFIGTIPVEQFTIEQVTEVFGGGDFIARGRTTSGTFNEERRFTIDHTILPKNPRAPKDANGNGPAVDVPAIVHAIREAMPKQDNNGLLEIVKVALQRPEPKGETAALMEMIKDMREESRRSEERFQKLLMAMQDSRQVEAPRSLREQLEDAKELMDMLGGRGGDEKDSFWKELGKGIAEVAAPMLKQHLAGAGGPVIRSPRAQLAPATPLTSAPASQPQPVNPEIAAASAETGAAADEEMKNPFIAAALNRFRTASIDAARKGKDPFEFVDNLIGMVPESYHGMIFNTANAADWFSRIFGADQESINHAPFLGEVRNSILAKAFIAHAVRSAQGGIDAAETAKSFVEWSTKDFDDALSAMADDPENWAAAFEGITIDAPWLEQLRKAVVDQLNDKPAQDSAKVVELPVTPRASGSGPASQKTRATKS